MTRYSGIARSIRRVLVVGAVTVASGVVAVQAQEQTQASSEETLQTVVVTGSLIKRANAETAEAITIIKADSLKDQGIVNVEQALNTLTSNTPSVNIAQSVGTFSGGGTYANLRNLGNSRTLVLIDGQRLAPNAFSDNAVDLSGIPFSAIDSIQVLREGASALYGSDAIAGVINFITKKNYQGLEVQANFDHPEKAGGSSGEGDITFGHGDLATDGYNLMITGSYSRQGELRATQRDFSAAGFYPAGGYTSTNNPGSWPGTVLDSNGNQYQAGFPGCAGNPYLTTALGNCAYRYSAATDLLPQSSEGSGMVSFTKALPANNTLQLQYFYTQSHVAAWAGPMFYFFQMDPASPYFPGNAQGPSVASLVPLNGATSAPNVSGITYVPTPANKNPCNPTTGPATATCVATPSAVAAIWTDPLNDRYSGNINTEQRALLQFKGSNGGWDYVGTLNYSQNKNDNRNLAGYPVEFPVAGYPNQPALAPGGVLSDLVNPFGPQTAAGQAFITSTYLNGTYSAGEDKRWSVDGNASHALGDAFNAGNPATVALGFDVNGERFTYGTTPYNDLINAATGLTDSQVEGSRSVGAVYMEVDVPISKEFDIDLSDREDRYSDFGRTNNGKISLRYQPASFLTFRGTASTGFRAPTLFDLYNPDSLAASTGGTMGSGNPDCANAGATPPSAIAPFTPATCITQGIGLFGGNRTLTPETSQNFDLGVIIQPIDNMGITLDWYRILLKNTIGAVPATAIYGNPTNFASYYVLNNSGGLTPSIQEATSCHPYTQPTCGYILLTDSNTGRITTSGFDLSIQYVQHTGVGTFREDLEGTAVTQFLQQQYNGGPNLNLVGEYNELPPAYRWQHNVRVDWSSPQDMFGAGLSNRFYSTYIDQFPDGAGNQRIVGSYSLVDAYATYKPVKNLTVLFGIKNLLDKSPPFTNAFQGNFAAGYNALTADPLGRNFYVNLKYTFF
jgi:iron complex outermembrane receptor protein